jgi:hypothetical protein
MSLPLALALVVAIPATAPSVSSIELGELVRRADLVVVARVERVVRVPRSEPPTWVPGADESFPATWDRMRELADELPVAELRIERVLEGPPDLKTVHFLARGTWTCDITGATEGERGLYFLEQDPLDSTLPGFVGSIRAAARGAPFCRVMHAGRGRMPFVGDPALNRVQCWSDVELPANVVQAGGHDARYSFIRHAPLDLLEKEIRAHVSKHGPLLRVRAPARGTSAAEWSLGIWADGAIEASVAGEDGTLVEIAPSAEAARSLAWWLAEERFVALPDSLGIPIAPASSIELELHTAERWKRVVVGDLGGPASDELDRALRIYREVRALLDAPGASDDRPRIRELLERKR